MISKKSLLIFSSFFFLTSLQGCGRFFKKDDSRPELSPHSSQFNSVVVFGDSLSDSGNIDLLTRGAKDIPGSGIKKAYPVSPPYQEGKFSNGKVWIDKFMNDLKLSVKSPHDCFFNINTNRACNFAVGGSTTSSSLSSDDDLFKSIKEFFNNEAVIGFLKNQKVPMHVGVKEMVSEYLSKDAPDDYALNHTLYVIWAGGNDYLAKAEIKSTVENIIASIKIILDHNPSTDKRYFLIPNLPDLGSTPYAITRKSEAKTLNDKSVQHNILLNKELDNLKNDPKYKEKVVIIPLDIEKFFKKIITSPASYGFTEVGKACYSKNYLEDDGKICNKPTEYLFWDEIHPTQHAHCLIGNLAEKTLIEANLIQGLTPDDKACH